MDKALQKFARQYVSALKQYLSDANEAGLEAAYRLGRQAIAASLGLLDLTRLHQNSVEKLGAHRSPHQLQVAETFFLEALSPFEVTHRGFRETNTRLAQLIETLEQRNTDLAALSNQILTVQEEERKHISRELHDEVGQALTAISVTLAALKRDCTGSSKQFGKKLGDAQDLLSTTMDTVHTFARELRPPMLDELGLLAAMRSVCNAFSERSGLQTRFLGDAEAESLSSAQKTVLFRVAQESLTNVARHAKATRVEIAIRKNARGICMAISDNGQSFDYKPDKAGGVGKRLGLLGMQERVRLIGGEFNIIAVPSQGTSVQVLIPVSEKN